MNTFINQTSKDYGISYEEANQIYKTSNIGNYYQY